MTVALFFWGWFFIIGSHMPFTDKIELIETRLEPMEVGNRYLVKDDDLFPTDASISMTGFFYAESMLITSEEDKRSKVLLPMSNLSRDIEKTRYFLHEGSINSFFPKPIEAVSDSMALEYAYRYYEEEYHDGEFKMWFHNNTNPNYFNMTDRPFEWLPIKETE